MQTQLNSLMDKLKTTVSSYSVPHCLCSTCIHVQYMYVVYHVHCTCQCGFNVGYTCIPGRVPASSAV